MTENNLEGSLDLLDLTIGKYCEEGLDANSDLGIEKRV